MLMFCAGSFGFLTPNCLPVAGINCSSPVAPAHERAFGFSRESWREFVEAIGDDLDVKFGLSFMKLAKPKPGETVLFSFIVYKSRAHRDQVNAKVMSDPRMNKLMGKGPMPFDVKRMAYGGFKTLVDL